MPFTALQMVKDAIFTIPVYKLEDIEDQSERDWLAITFAAPKVLQPGL